MLEVFNVYRKSILIACSLVLLFSAVAFALNVKPNSQPQRNASRTGKSDLIKQVEASPEELLRVVGNDDCPLRLVEARVKEIPRSMFTKLTGKTTDLATVSSVPEAKIVNTSEKTVTGFILIIRDPESRTTRALMQSKIALKPGETHTVMRESFGTPEKLTVADNDGQMSQRLVMPEMDSEKRWIHFASRSDLFVTIGKVNFEDGSSWTIKEGGDVR